MAANQNVTQLTQQVGTAAPTSLFYAVTNGTTDTGLPLSVFVNSLGLTGTPTTPTATTGTNTTQIASTAFVQAQLTSTLAAYAPLASPTFTGTVTIPTVTISAGTINGVTIGGSVAGAGTFTTLTTTGLATLSSISTSSASINGGSVNSTSVGATTPSTGSFTSLKSTNDKVIMTNTSAQSIPNNVATVVTNWTSVLNQGAHFVTATGIYTAPAAGVYRVSAQVQFTSATYVAGNLVSIEVFQNGALKYLTTNIITAAATQPFYTGCINVLLNCAANDTISVAALQNQGGAVALANSANSCFLMIEQLA